MTQPTKGYLIVASRHINFYQSAIFLIETIKDYYSEAKVCLVTEKRFLDGREIVADDIIFCGNHNREKLWAMHQSPYDITFYLDADMQCLHQDISTVFDHLGDNDLVFTGLPEHRNNIFNGWEFPAGHFSLCGAVCLYDKRKPIVMEFLKDWDELYKKQKSGDWWPLNANGQPDYINYPEEFHIWDQFSLWWLTEKEEKYKELKIKIFDDDLRWNYWVLLTDIETPKDPAVLLHMSASMKKTKPFVNRLYTD